MGFCVACGTASRPSDAFCGSCGASLTPKTTEGQSPPTPPPVGSSPGAAPPVPNDKIEPTYEKVGSSFRTAGIKFIENAVDHRYSALYGSTAVNVTVTPAGEGDTWVQFVAPVVIGARLGPDLYEYLIRKNAEWTASQFCVNPQGEILLAYALPGSIIDEAWCRQALAFVAITADEQDDEIKQRWGGKSAQEAIVG